VVVRAGHAHQADLHRAELGHDMVGREQVRADPQRHGELDHGEDGQGHRHRGDGAPDEDPDGGAEDEGERGVAERGDAVAGEDRRGKPARVEQGASGAVAGGSAERCGPPGLHQAESLGDGDGGQADHAELDRQPPGAADALGPGQPERPGLQLAGDQRGAPEDADDGGSEDDDRDADHVQRRIGTVGLQLPDEAAGQTAAAAVMAAADPAGGVQAGQVRAGDGQQDGERHQGRDRGDGLGTELAPAQPDHCCTSRRRRPRPVTWLR
jgi:hypothetical protein